MFLAIWEVLWFAGLLSCWEALHHAKVITYNNNCVQNSYSYYLSTYQIIGFKLFPLKFWRSIPRPGCLLTLNSDLETMGLLMILQCPLELLIAINVCLWPDHTSLITTYFPLLKSFVTSACDALCSPILTPPSTSRPSSTKVILDGLSLPWRLFLFQNPCIHHSAHNNNQLADCDLQIAFKFII